MRAYLTFIFIAMLTAIGANVLGWSILTQTFSWWHITLLVVGVSVSLFGLDAVFATIIHFMLPKKWFDPKRKIYRTSAREKRFYEAIKINKWKDKIPETGKLIGQYDKTQVGAVESKNLYMFLRETCYAEIIHYFMILVSLIVPLVYFFLPFAWADNRLFWPIIIPCSLVNFVLQFPPIFVQRNNRPKLLKIYEITVKREARANAECRTQNEC